MYGSGQHYIFIIGANQSCTSRRGWAKGTRTVCLSCVHRGLPYKAATGVCQGNMGKALMTNPILVCTEPYLVPAVKAMVGWGLGADHAKHTLSINMFPCVHRALPRTCRGSCGGPGARSCPSKAPSHCTQPAHVWPASPPSWWASAGALLVLVVGGEKGRMWVQVCAWMVVCLGIRGGGMWWRL